MRGCYGLKILISIICLSNMAAFARPAEHNPYIEDTHYPTVDPEDRDALQNQRLNAIMGNLMYPFPIMGASITYDRQFLRYYALGGGIARMFWIGSFPFIDSVPGEDAPVSNILVPIYFHWYILSSDSIIGRMFMKLQAMPMFLRSHHTTYVPMAISMGLGYEYRHKSGFIFRIIGSTGISIYPSLSFYNKKITTAAIPVIVDIGIGYAF